MRKKNILIPIFLFLSLLSQAQSDTAFWFAAPNVDVVNDPTFGQYDRPIYLRLTSAANPANVTVSIPANNAFVPINITIPANSTSTIDLTTWIDLIENFEPATTNNKGILIQSNTDITAYYEVNSITCHCNPELFSLKGRNALGNEFYVPSQLTWSIDTIRFPNAKAAFEIVATQNNTTITITPTKPITGHQAGVPFTIILNRGQSYSCQALYRNGPNLLNGSKIISDKPIAVTTKEDLLFTDGACADLAGDQLIPTAVFGNEYAVVRGDLTVRDKVVITAKQNNTSIYLNGNATAAATINTGQSYEVDLTSQTSLYITANNAVSVYHYTGSGCEVGSAIIPKLNCTGSSTVSIVRSNSGNAVVLLVTKNGNQGGFLINGVAGIITAADFSPLPGTGNTYVFTKKDLTGVMQINAATTFSNAIGKFQLGFINGDPGGYMYGYFSDFKKSNVSTTQADICKFDSAQLNATGGVTYQWTPSTGLSNPNISNPKASPSVTTNYKVVITDVDGCIDSAFVNVIVNTCTLACNNWLKLPSYPSSVSVGDLDVTGNQLTVEASFSSSTALNPGLLFGKIVSKHTGPSDVNYSLMATTCEITTTNGYVNTPGPCMPVNDKLYHVAMVYNGTTLKFYRNGYLLSSIPWSGNLINNDWLTTIGSGPNSPGSIYQQLGYINEVRIWNVARTQAQLQAYMNSSLPNPTTQTGLLGYYTFNDLTNKQGNPAYNGTLNGAASINATNPNCTFVADSCGNVVNTVVASFTTPDTVCVNTPVTITNTSVGASTYFWNFCTANINQPPVGTNLGNPGGALSLPVYIDYVYTNGNYYGFVSNNFPGGLVRLDFGNSLLNTPTSTFLGNFGGAISNNAEGIQVAQDNGKWYVLIVGGYTTGGTIPSLVTVSLGTNIANNTPTAVNWGNIGNLAYPHDLYVFNDNGHWYGLTVNFDNNTITRFDLTTSLANTPTAVNLGNIGNLNGPTGIQAINNNGSWLVFVTNALSSTLSRLDFGPSLLNNTPTGVNLGNPGNKFFTCWDIYVLKYCGQNQAFVINANTSYNDIVKLDFGNSLLNTPTAVSLGNQGNLNFPHCLSKLFRVGPDVYSFVANVNSNSITALKFPGCTAANVPNSTLQNPPPVIYNTPGTYNINLTIDDGLPTQSSFCKQVVVLPCSPQISSIINNYTPVLGLDPCKNILTVGDGTAFNTGDTVLLIQMKGAVIDSTNTASFGTITNYKNAGNYEFNFVKSKAGNNIELKNTLTRNYDLPNGKVQLIRVPYYQKATVTSTLTCPPWNGSTGGVLVFNVADSLILNANIDVSGKGFAGGTGFNSGSSTLSCFQNNYNYSIANNAIAGQKGESITTISQNIICGKGNPAGGGGAGLGHNSGGGGGGNGGHGGFGGYQLDACGNSPYDNRGIGGLQLAYATSTNKIFMGSGGGAGQADNPGNIPPGGGNGGGMVIINSNSIKSNSFKISANGNPAVTCSIPASPDCHDGMGGGGAGGTVLLSINQILDNTIVETKGGKGADMIGSVALGGRVAAGGGGGGGLLFVNTPSVPVNITNTNSGGANGVLTTDGNNPWGATPGQTGQTLFNLALPVDAVPFKVNIDSVRFNFSSTSCSNVNFVGLAYVNTVPVASWFWDFGDGNFGNTQNVSHNYNAAGSYNVKLVITDNNGCKDSIIKPLVITAVSNFDFSYKQDVCNPLSVQFTGAGTPLVNPYWSFGDAGTSTGTTTPTHTYAAAGNYLVKFTVTNAGCNDTISKTISVNVIPADIIITPDTTICFGATKQLRTQPALSFCWSPTTYLNNPLLPNPVTSTPGPITYYFTAETIGANIITNGNFSNGNTGFTSGYNYAAVNTIEGEYFVGPNPQAWNASLSNCTDHTTGNGNMLLVNGAPVANVEVWRQTVNVTPNTNYAFSTWIQALYPPNPAQLSFSINSIQVGNLITASLPTCTWSQFYTTWNSGNNTTATISIVNKNTIVLGNDFALDDISFAPVTIKRDSVKITVDTPAVTALSSTAVCPGIPVQLQASGASTYSWAPPTGLSNANIANPIATPATTTSYIATGTTIHGCVAQSLPVTITVLQRPVITKSNDTAICKASSVQLFASGGTSYTWTPAATLNNPNIANPVASPTAPVTKYYVTVINNNVNTCSKTDSVKITLRPDPVFTVSAAQTTCLGTAVQLNATGGSIYLWSPAGLVSNPGIANPVTTTGSTTNYSVTITESVCNVSQTLSTVVTVNPTPQVTATKSNDIDCSIEFSNLLASGASQYVWTPAASLNNSVIANPVARPITTTQYIVKGTNAYGCSDSDTLTVAVTVLGKSGYNMPNTFTPNGDGINDCYGIKYWGIIQQLEFFIYNRYGERVFYTTDPTQCWDGTYKGARPLPGNYVYYIKAKTACGTVERKGNVLLIR